MGWAEHEMPVRGWGGCCGQKAKVARRKWWGMQGISRDGMRCGGQVEERSLITITPRSLAAARTSSLPRSWTGSLMPGRPSRTCRPLAIGRPLAMGVPAQKRKGTLSTAADSDSSAAVRLTRSWAYSGRFSGSLAKLHEGKRKAAQCSLRERN